MHAHRRNVLKVHVEIVKEARAVFFIYSTAVNCFDIHASMTACDFEFFLRCTNTLIYFLTRFTARTFNALISETIFRRASISAVVYRPAGLPESYLSSIQQV